VFLKIDTRNPYRYYLILSTGVIPDGPGKRTLVGKVLEILEKREAFK